MSKNSFAGIFTEWLEKGPKNWRVSHFIDYTKANSAPASNIIREGFIPILAVVASGFMISFQLF